MKRLYAALVLLAVITGGSIFQTWHITRTISALQQPLSELSDCIDREDFETVCMLLERSHTSYLKEEGLLSAFVNEKLLDEVRIGYARTQAVAQTDQKDQLYLELAALQQALDDVLRSEIISWKNII